MVFSTPVDCGTSTNTRARAMSGTGSLGLSGNYTGQAITELPNCLTTDNFTVSVAVLDHLWVLFEPHTPPASANCSSYIFDSEVLTDASGTYMVGILQGTFILISSLILPSPALTPHFGMRNRSAVHLRRCQRLPGLRWRLQAWKCHRS